MTHTPGPWAVTSHRDKAGITTWGVEEANGNPIVDTLDQGEARLIAAAPALLEALEACECVLSGDDHSFDEAKKLARAAIALAKGEQ